MASAPVVPFVSVEEYLDTTYEPECEYIDGKLQPKRMGSKQHSRLQLLIARLLSDAEASHNLYVYPEFRIKVGENRFRVPDLAVFVGPAAGERFASSAPLCTIEVVSPDERWSEITAKASDHLSAGTAVVLIADPRIGSVYTVRPESGLQEVRPPRRVAIPAPDRGILTLDFDELFAKV
jgi:Uma2 family endonuclease